jgi:hypothetical protein
MASIEGMPMKSKAVCSRRIPRTRRYAIPATAMPDTSHRLMALFESGIESFLLKAREKRLIEHVQNRMPEPLMSRKILNLFKVVRSRRP